MTARISRIRLFIEEIRIWLGFRCNVEIVGAVPHKVLITKLRLRKHDLGCGLIGVAEVQDGLSKVTLKAAFYKEADVFCDSSERIVLVRGDATFYFSLTSSNHDVVRATLQIETQ